MASHEDLIRRRKAQIRKRMLHLREALSAEEVQEKSKVILERLRRDRTFRRARCVHCYVSFRKEVDTHALIEEALRRGVQVVVPLSNPKRKELYHYRIERLSELETGPFGTLIPKPAFRRLVRIEEVDVVLVPGIAFDLCGHRIGFGGGFYDRFLASIVCPKIGLAYEFQMMESIPTGPHDRRVHRIITEEKTYEPCVCDRDAERY